MRPAPPVQRSYACALVSAKVGAKTRCQDLSDYQGFDWVDLSVSVKSKGRLIDLAQRSNGIVQDPTHGTASQQWITPAQRILI